MSEDDKDFDSAFNAVVSDEEFEVTSDDEETAELDDTGDQEETSDPVDEKPEEVPAEPSEIEKLQQTVMRQAASQSALQKKLDNASVIKPKLYSPVLDEDGVFTESFKELKEEFPEADFGRVENIITQQNDQIAQLHNDLQAMQTNIQDTTAANNLKEQTAIVKLSHPDIAEVAQSEEFNEWQKTLTPTELKHVRGAVDADEINNILNVFKSVTGYKSKAALEAESTEKAEATVKKREKRSKAAQGIQTKQQASPATGAVDKLNEDAIFDEVFEKLGVS